MNKILLFILLCLPLAVSAEMQIQAMVPESAPVNVEDCMASCHDEVITNTEFVDSTTVTAMPIQAGPDLTVAPTNEGLTQLSTETLALNSSYEVGWRSS